MSSLTQKQKANTTSAQAAGKQAAAVQAPKHKSFNPVAKSATLKSVSHSEIAQRAYRLWQLRGCPIGDGNQDWFAAERELLSR